MMKPLILASASPRRQELLRNAGFDFEVRPSAVDERRLNGEAAEDYVLRLAREKALAVAASSPAGALVLGADTTVAVDRHILGKPADAADAVRMLRLLSGSIHRVITGVCLVRAPATIERLRSDVTWVHFRRLDEDEIQEYVATGEPFDKAGGYAIQGRAPRFVTRVAGSYSNVMGLPVELVEEMLKAIRGS